VAEVGEPLSFFNSTLLVINLSKGAVMCCFTNQIKEAIFHGWSIPVRAPPLCLDTSLVGNGQRRGVGWNAEELKTKKTKI